MKLLCPTLHDPMDCSLPGSSVHGIFQARVLEWSATLHQSSSSLSSPSPEITGPPATSTTPVRTFPSCLESYNSGLLWPLRSSSPTSNSASASWSVACPPPPHPPEWARLNHMWITQQLHCLLLTNRGPKVTLHIRGQLVPPQPGIRAHTRQIFPNWPPVPLS